MCCVRRSTLFGYTYVQVVGYFCCFHSLQIHIDNNAKHCHCYFVWSEQKFRNISHPLIHAPLKCSSSILAPVVTVSSATFQLNDVNNEYRLINIHVLDAREITILFIKLCDSIHFPRPFHLAYILRNQTYKLILVAGSRCL